MRSLYQTIMDYLWERGVRPSVGYVAAPAGVVIDGRPLSDFTSECPEGYDTVMGYLARTNPESVALLPDFCQDTQRDGWWLTNQARRKGLKVVKVRAPLVLRQCDRHIEQVNAYPLDLLDRRFGG